MVQEMVLVMDQMVAPEAVMVVPVVLKVREGMEAREVLAEIRQALVHIEQIPQEAAEEVVVTAEMVVETTAELRRLRPILLGRPLFPGRLTASKLASLPAFLEPFG